jgi:selenophosphate synthetase-related protein
MNALEAQGIEASAIGTVQDRPDVVLRDREGEKPLPTFERDEIARLFESPINEDA